MTMAKEMLGGGVSAGQAAAMGGQGASLAAAGSAQGDATTVLVSITIATGADGTKGVILPAGNVGDEIWIFNNSASTLKVYPPTGAAISLNGTSLGVANTAFSHLTFKSAVYKCQSSTQWFVIVTA
jgi:hypothetical protein